MARDPRTPRQLAASRAERQRGLLTAKQLTATGVSPAQAAYAAAVGGWTRLARGLYGLPGSTPSWERDALAACLLAGPDALAGLLTAAALWGWCRAPVLPYVAVPRSHSHRSPLGRIHRTDVPAVDRAVRAGIPCTSASRTIVDCASIVERTTLESFVDDALCSGVAATSSIEAAADRAGRRGRRGMAMLDDVLAVWTADIRPDTVGEARLLRRLDVLGVSGVVTQHEVVDEAGRFVARLDLAVPDAMVGLEYDSDRWHNPRHWAKDEPRYARLRALGWTVHPVCKLDLLPSSTRLGDLFGP
jgi:hypothetical protein